MHSSPLFYAILLVYQTRLTSTAFDFNNNNDQTPLSSSGGGGGGYYATNTAQNLSSSVGQTVYLNCSLDNTEFDDFTFQYSKYSAAASAAKRISKSSSSMTIDLGGSSSTSFNPTWLKAECVYNQNGLVESHRVENIIVTRKGIIADSFREKIKLVQAAAPERVQVLKLTDLEIRDEGKYICREFSARIDRTFYLSVFCKLLP